MPPISLCKYTAPSRLQIAVHAVFPWTTSIAAIFTFRLFCARKWHMNMCIRVLLCAMQDHIQNMYTLLPVSRKFGACSGLPQIRLPKYIYKWKEINILQCLGMGMENAVIFITHTFLFYTEHTGSLNMLVSLGHWGIKAGFRYTGKSTAIIVVAQQYRKRGVVTGFRKRYQNWDS